MVSWSVSDSVHRLHFGSKSVLPSILLIEGHSHRSKSFSHLLTFRVGHGVDFHTSNVLTQKIYLESGTILYGILITKIFG